MSTTRESAILVARVARLEDAVGALDTRAVGHTEQIAQLGGRVAELEGRVADGVEFEGRRMLDSRAFDLLEARVRQIEVSLRDRIDVEIQIAELLARMAAIHSRIDRVEDCVGTMAVDAARRS